MSRLPWTRLVEVVAVVGVSDEVEAKEDGRYAVTVLQSFPAERAQELPQLAMLPSFCFSSASRGVRPLAEPQAPRYRCFALTDEVYNRLYCSVLLYEEPLVQEKGRYATRGLCLVSPRPYISLFREFLASLYRKAAGGQLRESVEAYVAYLLYEVPLPPPGGLGVGFYVDEKVFHVHRASSMQFEVTDMSLRPLFECLDMHNIVRVLGHMLLEDKILFHSRHAFLLGLIPEILSSLIYPFRWHCTYIPLLPEEVLEAIEMPSPYMLGVESAHMPQLGSRLSQPLSELEVVVVDLDDNTLTAPSDRPQVPESAAAQLRSYLFHELNWFMEHIDLALSEDVPLRSWADVQRRIHICFLRFFYDLFGDYRQHWDASENWLHTDRFLAARPAGDRAFFDRMLRGSIMLQQFLEQRQAGVPDLFEDLIRVLSPNRAASLTRWPDAEAMLLSRFPKASALLVIPPPHQDGDGHPSPLAEASSYASSSSSSSPLVGDLYTLQSADASSSGLGGLEVPPPPNSSATGGASLRGSLVSSFRSLKDSVRNLSSISTSRNPRALHLDARQMRAPPSGSRLLLQLDRVVATYPSQVEARYIRALIRDEAGLVEGALRDYDFVLDHSDLDAGMLRQATDRIRALLSAHYLNRTPEAQSLGPRVAHLAELLDLERRKRAEQLSYSALSSRRLPNLSNLSSSDSSSSSSKDTMSDPNNHHNQSHTNQTNTNKQNNKNNASLSSSSSSSVSTKDRAMTAISAVGEFVMVTHSKSDPLLNHVASSAGVVRIAAEGVVDEGTEWNTLQLNFRDALVELGEARRQQQPDVRSVLLRHRLVDLNDVELVLVLLSGESAKRKALAAAAALQTGSGSGGGSGGGDSGGPLLPNRLRVQVPVSKLQRFVKALDAVYATKRLSAASNQLALEPGEVMLKVSPTVFDSRGSHGRLLLTSRRLLIRCSTNVELRFADLEAVEEMNYKVVIPPGMPCLLLHVRNPSATNLTSTSTSTSTSTLASTSTSSSSSSSTTASASASAPPGSSTATTTTVHSLMFYSFEHRGHWRLYVREMLHAARIGAALQDPRVQLLAAARLNVLTALNKIKCRLNLDMLRLASLGEESFFSIEHKLSARVVLNDYFAWNETTRDWVVVSQTLLRDVMDAVYSHVAPDGRSVDLAAIRACSEFQEGVRKRCGELQHAQLDAMTEDARLAFFVNVLNVMIVHAYIDCGFPTSIMDVRYLMRFARYSIGGMLYTISDIYHGILRANAAQPWFAAPPFEPDDPRLRFACSNPRPEIHFAVCLHFADSPALRELDAETVHAQLQAAASEFVMEHVLCPSPSDPRAVELHWLFDVYAVDFGEDPLRSFVLPRSIGKQRASLARLLASDAPNPTAMVYTPPHLVFMPQPLRSL